MKPLWICLYIIAKELKRRSALLIKINPNSVVSANFPCAILDNSINYFGITPFQPTKGFFDR
jgi:hypothetical protein